MPLSFPAEPTGTRAALAAGLSALAGPATPTAQAHATAAANAQAPPPLPVYPFGLNDLAGGKDPRGGSPVAWEYLLVAGTQAVRTAQVVSAPGGGSYEFASVSGGQAAGLARAIEVAENDPTVAAGDYELRLAKVPALYVTAVWLKDRKGAADYFVVVPPAPDGFQAHVVLPAADFLKTLQAQAVRKVQATPGPTAGPASATPGAPTN